MSKWIDLTHPLEESVPSWNGGCGFSLTVKMDYSEGVLVNALRGFAGVGTHMDAPSHFIPEGSDIASIPIENFIVPIYVLDVSCKSHPDFFIEKKEIEEFEKRVGRLEPFSLFTAYTGWEKYWPHPDQYRNVQKDGKMHFPGFSKEAALYLMEKKIVGLGIDTLSPDGSNNGKGADTYPVHQAVLGGGGYILENLKNLSLIAPKGFAISLPIPIKGGSEAYCRVIALPKTYKISSFFSRS